MPAMLPQHRQKRRVTVVRKNMGSRHRHLIQIAYCQLPLSIPTDFMHLVFEDVLTTLVNLLGGTSSNLGKEHFVAKEKWEEIGRATANSGNTIPSCFAARFPISLSPDRDVRLTVGRSGSDILPVPSMYYKHIMRFSKLERECLEFEYRRDRVPGLKRDWARWVEDYERLYYKDDPTHLHLCSSQVHLLLCIVDFISRYLGQNGFGGMSVGDMRVARLISRESDGRSASLVSIIDSGSVGKKSAKPDLHINVLPSELQFSSQLRPRYC
ncbi:hypothetical protein I305_00540 [Cryptococcus gattii E566]|uniref:Uncharacterized protein n=1 Tax=Cryptococcus gattii EJB2 TaxID=1296103 RepID=A0ABR5C1A2_9TREE|nr:hypothetical protein I306_01249 [Cryptococcus gattii EJB2]KIY36492.1 hypothetical protein I305_00540 [Cryptococcus gattii E566]KJE00026.1 hypothetical protein I311_06384 [Cryptococcus gattii NT-10]